MGAERRFVENKVSRVRIQQRDGAAPLLVGYAAVFYREADPGTQFELWDDLVERIMPGAFDRALREGDDARAVFNHNPSFLLGRVAARTCRLAVDEIGLRYEVDLPDTSCARDLQVSIDRGDCTGSSFAFESERTVWVEEGDLMIRQVEAVRLYDVGPVTFPAYEATTTGLRSADVDSVRAELAVWQGSRRCEIDEVDLAADAAKAALTLRRRAS